MGFGGSTRLGGGDRPEPVRGVVGSRSGPWGRERHVRVRTVGAHRPGHTGTRPVGARVIGSGIQWRSVVARATGGRVPVVSKNENYANLPLEPTRDDRKHQQGPGVTEWVLSDPGPLGTAEAAPRRDVGEVRHPQLIRTRRHELAIDEIRRPPAVACVGRGDPAAPAHRRSCFRALRGVDLVGLSQTRIFSTHSTPSRCGRARRRVRSICRP